ncbi:DUF4157 domain-containing protein [Methanosarcina sp. Z-7115]|uniref:DUF4157 domain-containing protein n=1 Tax=Methanosarcina baikalica TaxID=3073890 RepID=A0ABU2D2V6_9EURY|nr:DUF4157 domain-containing protein [Methanosarcina sp. Z-7115]MDR7666321.1 DUF4157 domain-containing protein [Methanosarcina sp. Z-7115]
MPEHQQTQQSTESKTTFQKQATPLSHTPASNPFSIIQRAKINPKSLTYADIMQLQRTIGNRAVGMLLTGIGNTSTVQQAPVQRQEIPEEEETCPSCMQRQEIPEEEEPLQGKMAETVQRQEIPEEEEPLQGKMIEPIQRQEIPEEEEPLQGKFENNPDQMACPSCSVAPIVQKQEIPEEEPLQGKMMGTIQRQEISEEEEPLQPNIIETVQQQETPKEEYLQTKKENNMGLPDNLKAGIENLSGVSMDNVKVHYNSDKPSQLQALAYAQGTDIHISPGQEQHLPHEAWHVVQQTQGSVKPTMQMKDGVLVNDNKVLEREADVMGAKALQKHSVNKSAFEFPVHQRKLDTLAGSASTGKVHLRSILQRKDSTSQDVVQLTTVVNVKRTQKLIQDCPGGKLAGTTFEWNSKFDVDIVDGKVMVTIRIKSSIPAELFQEVWVPQVARQWSNRFMLMIGTETYPIVVRLLKVDKDAHYTVTAVDSGRALGSGSRGYFGTSHMTEWGVHDVTHVGHEVGHMLGNPDEYGEVETGGHKRNYLTNPSNTIMGVLTMGALPGNPVENHYYLIKWAAEQELKKLGRLPSPEESKVVPYVEGRLSVSPIMPGMKGFHPDPSSLRKTSSAPVSPEHEELQPEFLRVRSHLKPVSADQDSAPPKSEPPIKHTASTSTPPSQQLEKSKVSSSTLKFIQAVDQMERLVGHTEFDEHRSTVETLYSSIPTKYQDYEEVKAATQKARQLLKDHIELIRNRVIKFIQAVDQMERLVGHTEFDEHRSIVETLYSSILTKYQDHEEVKAATQKARQLLKDHIELIRNRVIKFTQAVDQMERLVGHTEFDEHRSIVETLYSSIPTKYQDHEEVKAATQKARQLLKDHKSSVNAL